MSSNLFNTIQNDDYYDIDDEMPRSRIKNQYLSQSLESPLLDLCLVKFSIILNLKTTLNDKNRLRNSSKMNSEKWFLNQLKKSGKIYGMFQSEEYDVFNSHTISYFCKLYRNPPPYNIGKKPTFPLFHSSSDLSKIFESSMSSWTQIPIDFIGTDEILTGVANDNVLKTYYCWMYTLEKFYDLRRQKSAMGNREISLNRIGPINIALTGQFMAIEIEGRITLGSLDMYLCLLDIIRVRFNTRLCTHTLKKTHLHQPIEDQYVWQESCLDKYHESGFEILKSTESMWKCRVSQISGGGVQSPDSYENMISKIREKELKIRLEGAVDCSVDGSPINHFAARYDETFLIDKLDMLCQQISEVEDAVELFGIVKSTGHPLINPEIGGESARTYAKAPMNSNPNAWYINWFIFKHLMLINYIKKHNKWPPVTFRKSELSFEDANIHTSPEGLQYARDIENNYKQCRLYKLWQQKNLYITKRNYDLSDWQYCEIGQVFTFDYIQDYLTLLNDKSCAPKLEELKQFYEGRDIDRASRRILKVMMNEKETDTEKLIKMFAENILDPDEFNILLYPKECEFKLAARMFCMLTFHMRLIFSIIQENVKEGVFSLLPYQSMTMNNHQLIKKLMSMTTPNPDEETIFIEVDLSRWNLCFRNIFVKGFGSIMDKMYNVSNVFGRSHEIFSRSLISVFVKDQKIQQFEDGSVINNPHIPMADSSTMWRNHMGGFEGIDQATWTVCTICMIFRALWNEDCRFILLGQGDNQTLAITRPRNSDEPLDAFSSRVMSKIEQSCADVNHIAKPEEFVESSTTLTYSKVFIVKGAIIPMTLKYAMKVSPLTSTEIPSFIDACGAIHSAAIGAASNCDQPLSLWLTAMFQQEILMKRFRDYGGWMGNDGLFLNQSGLQIRSDAEKLILTVPSVIGGLPICSPTSYICRNEPDPLTAEIAMLRKFALKSQCHAKYLSLLRSKKLFHKNITSYDKLISDPYSLPFAQSKTQQSVLEDLALQTIRNSVKNDNIRELVNVTSSENEEKFIKDLSSMRPFMPLIAHDMYAVSWYGRVNQFSKKFNTTRTFISDVNQIRNPHINIRKVEVNNCFSICLRFVISKSADIDIPNSNTLSMDIANELRTSWGDIDMDGLSTAHPLDYSFNTQPEKISGVIAVSNKPFNEILKTRGAFRPYLGMKTFEKQVGKQYEVQKSSSLDELKKLVLLSTAAMYNDNGNILLDRITASRSAYPLSQLKSVLPITIGGIVHHRYNALEGVGTIGPVGNVMLASNLTLNSNNIENLSGSKNDYPIAFQQFFSYLISSVRCIALSNHNVRIASIDLKVNNLPMLVNSNLDFDKPISEPFPTRPNNPLVYVNEIKIKKETTLEAQLDLANIKKLSAKTLIDLEARTNTLLISSLIYLGKANRAQKELQDDDSELVKNTTGSIRLDTAAVSSLNPANLVSATLLAAMYLGIYDCTRSSSSYPFMYASYESALIIWIKNICYLWSDQIPINEALRKFLIREDLWKAEIGSRSHISSFDKLCNNLVTRTVNLTYNLRYLENCTSSFLWLSKSRTLTCAEVCKMHTCLLMWIDYLKYTESLNHQFTSVSTMKASAHSSPLRRAANDEVGIGTHILATFNSMKRSITQVGDISLPANYSIQRLTLLLNEENYYHRNRIVPSELLLQFVNWSCISCDVSEEELTRWFRLLEADNTDINTEQFYDNSQRPIALVPIKSQLVLKNKNDLVIPEVPLVGPLRNLENRRPLREDIKRRFKYHHGLHSTAGTKWVGPISLLSESDNVCVLGTGAGGIQRVLDLLGVKSTGFDLQSSIPFSRLGDRTYKPPEIINSKDYTQFSFLNHCLSGDIFEFDCLQTIVNSDAFTHYFVDVEQGNSRYGFEVVDSLLSSGVFGTVCIKFFLTKTEFENILSSIVTIGSNTRVYVPYDMEALTDNNVNRTTCVLIQFEIHKSSLPFEELTSLYEFDLIQTHNERSLATLPDDTEQLLNNIFNLSSIEKFTTLNNVIECLRTDVRLSIRENIRTYRLYNNLAVLFLMEKLKQYILIYDSTVSDSENIDLLSRIMEQDIINISDSDALTITVNNLTISIERQRPFILRMLSKTVPRVLLYTAKKGAG